MNCILFVSPICRYNMNNISASSKHAVSITILFPIWWKWLSSKHSVFYLFYLLYKSFLPSSSFLRSVSQTYGALTLAIHKHHRIIWYRLCKWLFYCYMSISQLSQELIITNKNWRSSWEMHHQNICI